MVSQFAPRGIQEMREGTMATDTPSATTRPARARTRQATPAPAKAAPAKATPAKQAAPKAEAPEATNVTRFKVELDHAGTTKSYEKFAFPDSFKGVAVGNVYAPIGTERVVVFIIGADDVESDTTE